MCRGSQSGSKLAMDTEAQVSWNNLPGWIGIIYVIDWEFSDRINIFAYSFGDTDLVIGRFSEVNLGG